MPVVRRNYVVLFAFAVLLAVSGSQEGSAQMRKLADEPQKNVELPNDVSGIILKEKLQLGSHIDKVLHDKSLAGIISADFVGLIAHIRQECEIDELENMFPTLRIASPVWRKTCHMALLRLYRVDPAFLKDVNIVVYSPGYLKLPPALRIKELRLEMDTYTLLSFKNTKDESYNALGTTAKRVKMWDSLVFAIEKSAMQLPRRLVIQGLPYEEDTRPLIRFLESLSLSNAFVATPLEELVLAGIVLLGRYDDTLIMGGNQLLETFTKLLAPSATPERQSSGGSVVLKSLEIQESSFISVTDSQAVETFSAAVEESKYLQFLDLKGILLHDRGMGIRAMNALCKSIGKSKSLTGLRMFLPMWRDSPYLSYAELYTMPVDRDPFTPHQILSKLFDRQSSQWEYLDLSPMDRCMTFEEHSILNKPWFKALMENLGGVRDCSGLRYLRLRRDSHRVDDMNLLPIALRCMSNDEERTLIRGSAETFHTTRGTHVDLSLKDLNAAVALGQLTSNVRQFRPQIERLTLDVSEYCEIDQRNAPPDMSAFVSFLRALKETPTSLSALELKGHWLHFDEDSKRYLAALVMSSSGTTSSSDAALTVLKELHLTVRPKPYHSPGTSAVKEWKSLLAVIVQSQSLEALTLDDLETFTDLTDFARAINKAGGNAFPRLRALKIRFAYPGNRARKTRFDNPGYYLDTKETEKAIEWLREQLVEAIKTLAQQKSLSSVDISVGIPARQSTEPPPAFSYSPFTWREPALPGPRMLATIRALRQDLHPYVNVETACCGRLCSSQQHDDRTICTVEDDEEERKRIALLRHERAMATN